jgi:hypothetical protein
LHTAGKDPVRKSKMKMKRNILGITKGATI